MHTSLYNKLMFRKQAKLEYCRLIRCDAMSSGNTYRRFGLTYRPQLQGQTNFGPENGSSKVLRS
jgi:hypothetical protein